MIQAGPRVEVSFVLEENGCREENRFHLEFKVTQILGYRAMIQNPEFLFFLLGYSFGTQEITHCE